MRVLILLILLGIVYLAQAQQNNTLFLMHDLPQSNIVNPSIPINCKLYIGLPVIGSTHINAFSTGFAVNDAFESYSGDSLRFNPSSSISKMKKLEIIATELHLTLLSVGYKHQNNYFTFTINEKLNSHQVYSKNALLLAYKGNKQFEGKFSKLDGLRVNATHYREYAFGWAREVNSDLNIGFRVKLLFGKGNIFTKPTDLRLFTHANTFALLLNGSGDMYSSFPIVIETNTNGEITNADLQNDIDWKEYALNTENKGLGFDIGFTYKINYRTTISGSLLDIGYINWKTNPHHLHSSGVLNISGSTYSDGLNSSSEFADSLSAVFNPSVDQSIYSAPLTPALYLGISRDVTDKANIGAVFHSEFYKNRLHPSITFSGNTNFGKILSTSISYTLANREFNNIGAGIGAKLGIIHLHAISDNIPAFLNLTGTRNINLRFGISILTGCKEKNRNKAIPCVGDPYNAVQRRHRR